MSGDMVDMTIIFDLGNVILPFDPTRPCRTLAARAGKTTDEVCDLIYANNLERRFEEGAISGHEFTDACSQVLGITLDYKWFHDLWIDMFTENTDVSTLVRLLKTQYPLMLLSNTNAWHWQYARKKFSIVREINTAILSYEIGVLKPHPRIYEAALAQVTTSGPVVFIDDIEANVEGARKAGLLGIHFHSVDQLRTELRNLGCRVETDE